MRILVVIFYSCLIGATGCAHRKVSQSETVSPGKMESVKLSGPTVFEYSGEKGHKEKLKHFYSSQSKSYEGKQLAHERSEITEFLVENEVIDVSKEFRWIEMRQKTLEKSGPAELNQMAFPELGEEVIFRYGKSGDVIKAGKYPEFSIFFVPPVPLPKHAIQVGDTWKYTTSWLDYNQGIEMAIDLVGVLKDTVSCFENEICLDIEYSGNVLLPEKLQGLTKFRGTAVARFLIRPKNYSILRSTIRNKESMAKDEHRMDIRSCIVSQVAGLTDQPLTCEPWN